MRDALEITALDTGCGNRREEPAPPLRLSIRVVNGVDRNDDAHAAMAPGSDCTHLLEPASHGRRREHHECSGPPRIHLC